MAKTNGKKIIDEYWNDLIKFYEEDYIKSLEKRIDEAIENAIAEATNDHTAVNKLLNKWERKQIQNCKAAEDSGFLIEEILADLKKLSRTDV